MIDEVDCLVGGVLVSGIVVECFGEEWILFEEFMSFVVVISECIVIFGIVIVVNV